MEYRKLRKIAREAAAAVKDPDLRDVAFHSILAHLYNLPRKRKRKVKR
jgi:hypothetical protein